MKRRELIFQLRGLDGQTPALQSRRYITHCRRILQTLLESQGSNLSPGSAREDGCRVAPARRGSWNDCRLFIKWLEQLFSRSRGCLAHLSSSLLATCRLAENSFQPVGRQVGTTARIGPGRRFFSDPPHVEVPTGSAHPDWTRISTKPLSNKRFIVWFGKKKPKSNIQTFTSSTSYILGCC